MFPNAHSQVYRNEDGEVLGWDNESSYEPEYCGYCGGNHSEFDCPAEDCEDDEVNDHDLRAGEEDYDE